MFDSIPAEEPASEEPVFDNFENSITSEDESEAIEFNYENEQLEEPVIDELSVDTEDETDENDLPSEIEISKEEDMFVESTESDFMDSVQDVTLDAEEIEDADIPSELPDETVEEEVSVAEETEDDIPTVDKLLDSETDNTDETPFAIDQALDNGFETESERSETEENENPEVSFAEVDNLDNNLTESNIDFLTKKDNSGINSDLKQDIKSVLLYMDQHLENLPEEKISEFAKSEEFNTYKKLFSELGLS